MKALIGIIILALSLIGIFITWIVWKEQQQNIQFWVPQLLLALLIIVTILYVDATFKLVEETRKMRPPVRLSISYNILSDESKGITIKTSESWKQTKEYISAICVKGGISQPEKDMKTVVLDVTNVGEKTIYDIRLNILIIIGGEEFNYIIDGFPKHLKKEDIARLAIAMAHPAIPFYITTKRCEYSDGTAPYTEFSGNGEFKRDGFLSSAKLQSVSTKSIQEEKKIICQK